MHASQKLLNCKVSFVVRTLSTDLARYLLSCKCSWCFRDTVDRTRYLVNSCFQNTNDVSFISNLPCVFRKLTPELGIGLIIKSLCVSRKLSSELGVYTARKFPSVNETPGQRETVTHAVDKNNNSELKEDREACYSRSRALRGGVRWGSFHAVIAVVGLQYFPM